MTRNTTEQELEVRKITIETFTTRDDEKLVDRVIFDCPDAPNGRVTYKPRTQETVTHEVNGVEAEETNTVRYALREFTEEYEGIGDAQKAIADGERVYMTADITEWDQSDEPDTDGEDTYAYIDRGNADTLTLEKGE